MSQLKKNVCVLTCWRCPAYEILSDAAKRAYYDQKLESGVVEWNEEAYQQDLARKEEEEKANKARAAQQRAEAASRRIETLEERIDGKNQEPEPVVERTPEEAALEKDKMILELMPFLKIFDMRTRSFIARVISGTILVRTILSTEL